RSNGTFVCFFLQLFLSNKEKVDRSPYQREIFYKKPRLFPKQNNLFALRFLIEKRASRQGLLFFGTRNGNRTHN
ncbi:MAG: hypothetical protein IJD59_02075, partial [Clostridia bacterium]|nr:hypothetical protein [Clostridia bacterium]